jgi:predicted nucleotidyltransferase
VREATAVPLHRYGTAHPRRFESLSRGDAGEGSDLDLLVDLAPDSGNELLRVRASPRD